MARYHINDKDEIGVCSAKIKCQFNLTDEEHFPNKKAAEAGLSAKLKGKMDELPKSAKKKQKPTEFQDFVTGDYDGNKVLKAGIWSGKVDDLLNGRQSLAFATEFVKKNGGAGIRVQYDQIPLTDEKGNPTTDEDDNVLLSGKVDFIKAYAIDKNGFTLWDANGELEPVFVEQFIDPNDEIERFDKFTVEEAHEIFGPHLPEQNYGFAASFVDDAAQNPIKKN